MNYLEIVLFSCCYNEVYFIFFVVSLQKKNVSLEFILHYPFLLKDPKLCVCSNTFHIVKSWKI